MQPFSVGTCLSDAFEALTEARGALLLVVVAASPLIAVAAYVLTEPAAVGGTVWALALLPAIDVAIAAIVTVAVFAALYDRPRPRILLVALRRLVAVAVVMALIYLVVLAVGFAAAIPLLDDARYKRDLVLGLVMLVVWMALSALLYTRWFVAVPATVIEYSSPVAALRRSDRLTRGHRTRLFAILALLGTLSGGAIAVAEVRLTSDATIFAIGVLAWIPTSVIRAAISATAYAQLRAATEAGDPERLAEVFG